MKKKKVLLILLPAFLGVLSGLAQEAILSAGGDATGIEGSISYSIGQVGFTSYKGEAGSISLGVQQPYLVIMVGNEEPEISILTSVSPNPTNASIELNIDQQIFSTLSTDNLSYGLHDINGKLLLQQKIVSHLTTIPMENLADAVYILRVMRHHEEIKSFKIFKTN